MPAGNNNYVLGRGKLYFDRFISPQNLSSLMGLKYFGNTPELTLTKANTILKHYNSDAGLKFEDASVTLQEDIGGTITCDNIDDDLIANWCAGNNTAFTQAAVTAPAGIDQWTIPTNGQDRFYQLGTSANPASIGVRNINTPVVTGGASGSTAAVVNTDYTIDLVSGLVYIVPGSTVMAVGNVLKVTYGVSAWAGAQIVTAGSEIIGAMRFISSNPIGQAHDYMFPYVKLTSNGDYALKGDTWQQYQFTMEALQLGTNPRFTVLRR